MPAPRSKDEFGLIEAFFAPLARGQPGAFGLRDDAAVVTPGPGRALVATTDLTVAGVHFMADDPPDLVARKSLRVNLSDLAAMGARPIAYLLGLAVPEDRPESWFEAFARGLAEDQEAYGIGLLGGDTTATPGPLCLSVTAFGDVEAGKLLRRRGAAPGDDLYVSGTVGDAALALRRLLGLASEGEAARTAGLSARYRLPEPRGTLGGRSGWVGERLHRRLRRARRGHRAHLHRVGGPGGDRRLLDSHVVGRGCGGRRRTGAVDPCSRRRRRLRTGVLRAAGRKGRDPGARP